MISMKADLITKKVGWSHGKQTEEDRMIAMKAG
jgi:hypothetical protein